MNRSKESFLTQAPIKILNKADQYSKTLNNYHELPKEISKSLMVKTKAEQQKEGIDFSIKMSEYQQHLFRNQERVDSETREKLRKKFEQSSEKIIKNRKQLQKRKNKKNQTYEKHVKQVYTRYDQEQKQKRAREKEQAYKLRTEIKEFYDKQEQRKSMNERLQVKVGPCYQTAVQRINHRHFQNQEFSRKAEIALQKDLRKNNKLSSRIGRKRRIVSEMNQKKPSIYDHSLQILEDKEQYFIQTCGRNEDGYLKAWDKMGKTITDWRKKKTEQQKRQLDRWKENKYRVQQANAQVPEKCLHILDQTSKASFRKTVSTFRDSSNRFQDIVLQNKNSIREHDESKKDDIMDLHLDMTLKNRSTNKMSQKMHSMRHHAKKMAYDFL